MTENITFPIGKTGSLTGHLLIATPVIQDSCFSRSVIYICSHSEEGAMGIIVNYPIDNLDIREIFEQLDIKSQMGVRSLPIHFGGPVEAHRGFVVHSADDATDECIIQKDGIAVTASIGVLKRLAEGKGPKQGMLVLGYAGWSAGQLESEIETGSWITVPASTQLVFDTNNETKWNVALSSLGIDMGHFSNTVGHA